jgi:hypothetical protein
MTGTELETAEKAFEARACRLFLVIEKTAIGTYLNHETQQRWQDFLAGWNACLGSYQS